MGIDLDVARFLFSARQRHADFQKTLMLGNQKFEVSNSDYDSLTDAFELDNFGQVKESGEFLRFLGAKEITSMDISDYEGATILHDLNQPIGNELKEKFTLVLDGGVSQFMLRGKLCTFCFVIADSYSVSVVSYQLSAISYSEKLLSINCETQPIKL